LHGVNFVVKLKKELKNGKLVSGVDARNGLWMTEVKYFSGEDARNSSEIQYLRAGTPEAVIPIV